MKRYILIFILAACLANFGCSESNLAANEGGLEPMYTAEVFVEEKGGVFRMSSSTPLVYATSTSESSSSSGSGTFTKKDVQTSQTQMFTTSMVGAGRMCDISPRFLRHDSGSDVWSLDLKYTKDGKEVLVKSGVKISFDGKKPVKVMEDEYHTVLVRPGK